MALKILPLSILYCIFFASMTSQPGARPPPTRPDLCCCLFVTQNSSCSANLLVLLKRLPLPNVTDKGLVTVWCRDFLGFFYNLTACKNVCDHGGERVGGGGGGERELVRRFPKLREIFLKLPFSLSLSLPITRVSFPYSVQSFV